METTWRRACLGAALVLVGLTLWRWHEVDAVRPARIEGVEGPTAILLLQPGDCPDRRAAVLRWLEGRPGREGTEPLRLMLGYLGEPPSVLDAPFARLPRLGAGEIPEAERALLRAGVEGTPALLLVDAEGTVVLADHFTTTGLGARAGVVALLDAGAHRPAARTDLPEA